MKTDGSDTTQRITGNNNLCASPEWTWQHDRVG